MSSRAVGLLALAAVALGGAAAATVAQDPPAAPEAPAAAPPTPLPPEALPPEDPAPPAAVEAPRAAAPSPSPPKPVEPLKRPRFASAVLQATDKITAETLRFEARVGEPVRYKGVVVTVRACETTAADEPVFDSMAHLDVLSQPAAGPGRPAPAPRSAFRGWMFAGSPGLHPFEHPAYDLWLIACKTPAPVVAAPSA